MRRKGLYAGSFDPVTYGHLDMIERASKLFDTLYISVAYNPKKKTLFTVDERIEMLKEVTKCYENVVVIADKEKLTVDLAVEKGASVIVRGLRAVTDFDYELQMASTNKVLKEELETIFMMTNVKYSFLSSSLVKEIYFLGGNISDFVPPYVEELLDEKKKIGIENK